MSKKRDVASICARLAELEAERSELNKQLVRFEAQRGQKKVGGPSDSPSSGSSACGNFCRSGSMTLVPSRVVVVSPRDESTLL